MMGIHAFSCCFKLTNVVLSEGLECIESNAFRSCNSLEQINLPSTLKSVSEGAFCGCTSLRKVDFYFGLEEIARKAFASCVSLDRIYVPSTVKLIHSLAFHDCRLKTVQFSNEFEEIVSTLSLQDWWHRLVPGMTMNVTYTFFARCNILERLSKIKSEKWQNEIHEMLNQIHSIRSYDSLWCHCEDVFRKLLSYERWSNTAFLLELALWKSKISEHVGCDRMGDDFNAVMEKSQHRMKCGATVIIPNVLSFLAEVGRWDRMMFTEFCLEPEEDNYDGFSVEDEFSDSELEDY
jgi:hypothetical protein